MDYEQTLATSEDFTDWRRVSRPAGLLWAAAAVGASGIYVLVSRATAPEGRGDRTYHLFVTADAGRTWSELVPRSGRVPERDSIEVFPGDPTRIMLLNDHAIPYVSHDNGKTWANVSIALSHRGTAAGISDYVRAPGKPSLWLAVNGRIVEARDAGATWRDVTGDLPMTSGTKLAYDAKEGYLYAATGAGLYRLKVGN